MSNSEDAYNSPKTQATLDAVRAFKEGPASLTDATGVNRVEAAGACSGSIGPDYRQLLAETLTTMRHARVFITSREKMHPTGVELWDELVGKIERALP